MCCSSTVASKGRRRTLHTRKRRPPGHLREVPCTEQAQSRVSKLRNCAYQGITSRKIQLKIHNTKTAFQTWKGDGRCPARFRRRRRIHTPKAIAVLKICSAFHYKENSR